MFMERLFLERSSESVQSLVVQYILCGSVGGACILPPTILAPHLILFVNDVCICQRC